MSHQSIFRQIRPLSSSARLNAKCPLTSERYNIRRKPYGVVKNDDVEYFKSLLEPHRVLLGEDNLVGHNTDWLNTVRGSSSVLLKPKTTEEVSKILSYCNKQNFAVCPQGGNTGLVGGSVPVFDEIIVSTSLMNNILSVDKWSGVMRCQAGCVLETLDEHLSDYGLMMPLDLGAKGSCHIGGNASTNAGGLRLLRYGSLHANILGIEAVLANGEIMDCMSDMKKDNTGFDLKHLFIGSEGTLGFVTKVSVQCPIRPTSTNLAFLAIDKFEDVLQTFYDAKVKLGEIMSSCEFIDKDSLDVTRENLGLKAPICDDYPFYMLIETSGSKGEHDEEKLSQFLEYAMNKGQVLDGTVASEPSRMLNIWSIRERIAEALLHDGYTFKYDISLPLPEFYKVVEEMRDILGNKVVRCCGYGHVGDGNIHFNVTTPEYSKEVQDMIEPFIYERTSKVNGSVSAEHGLGFKKRNCISYSKSSSAIGLMKQIKQILDPKGILNPYKVLPDN